ncbi:hypothetical protein [Granulicella sp. S156]|jgi:predicted MFS family arabinose efflux permease|uniref:hypothetical protein n=1 Tax=Granulicella sp. S156 TaxID=1747224 RepID=UPI00131D7C7A|nr:hypothetical protein [Granulicella sp. S156]
MKTVKSSSPRAWLSVATVALASFILITTEFLPIGFLERLGLAFHVEQGTAGLMVTNPGMVTAFDAPLATLLAGRVDRRFVLGASPIVSQRRSLWRPTCNSRCMKDEQIEKCRVDG